MRKGIKKHYHWMIAAVMLLIMAIRGGAANNLASLHLIPVTEALQISRTQFSLAGSASAVVSTLATMVSGAMLLRYGHRTLLTVFVLIAAGAYALMSCANNYAMLFAGYLLLGTTVGICGDAGATRLVNVWFHKHRGVVLGLISSATGVGGSLLCIFQSAAIQRISYRASYGLVAALLVICGILTFLLIRNHPSKMGLQPYGDGQQITYKKRRREQDHWQGLPMDQLARRPAFYLMLFGTLICCTLPYLAYNVVVPHFQDKGFSAAQAGSLQSVLLLCLTGAKILTGYLCDVIGARKAVMLCMACDVVALVLLVVVKSFAMALVTVVIFAMAIPVMTVIIPMLAGSLFGYHAQSQYNGFFLSMVSAASMLSGPISNAVYDKVGSYDPVFLTAAALNIALMGVYLLMYRLADKDRKKLEESCIVD